MADQTVYVLFNGLFFMEFQGSKLVAIAPQVLDVPVIGREVHEHWLGPPTNRSSWTTDIDLSTNVLTTSAQPRTDFPRTIPQFSGGQTGTGHIKKATGALQVTLPLPIAILPLRVGNFSDFPNDPSNHSNVFDSMTQFTNGQFSMITCLQYNLPDANRPNWPGGTENRCHFYSEEHCDLGAAHLQMALDQSRVIFNDRSAFDLADVVDPIAMRNDIPAVDPGIPGLDRNDEKTNGELHHCRPGTNPANCGQYAVNP